MTNKAKIFYNEALAGSLEKNDDGYSFIYDDVYLKSKDSKPVSQTLPLRPHPYTSRVLFSFFDGLIPEGWLLNIASKHWKIKGTDRFELLITLCRDTIGAVTVLPNEEEDVNG
ncbi:HipA domain-containing protein [Pedobacter cryoconitis]|uniref:HipA domain-containing protein n=1 Tax=Pedobacter cryoconitis TaxID=188932 RepID=A0A127V8W9_9SPHI|nr:HipA N-terminal domain-containing protein [Pedobacter cryoconitis]AMP97657.1 HipA domain-containing protein [Pedobacter cryoconitis]